MDVNCRARWAILAAAVLLIAAGVDSAPSFTCIVAETAREHGFDDVLADYGPQCDPHESTESPFSLFSAPESTASASGSASSSTTVSSTGSTAASTTTTRPGSSLPFRVLGSSSPSSTRVRLAPPIGPWVILSEAHVDHPAPEAWYQMRNFGNVLVYGLEGFASDFQSLDAKSQKWRVLLNSGEYIKFSVIETDNVNYYHIVRIDDHSREVFPGIDAAGSMIFIRFHASSEVTTTIQFGWGGRVSGQRDTAITVIGAWGQLLLENLESKFGESCEDATNVRTIEGDCNNLGEPRRGAAGHPLLRLGGVDPSFPNGDPNKPSGPLQISPRLISNELCANSPGATYLEQNAEQLSKTCVVYQEFNRAVWRVCPYRYATKNGGFTSGFEIEWKGITTRKDSTLVLHFDGPECTLDLSLVCHGQPRVELADKPCGSEGNRFYHPVACRIRPGEDEVLANREGLTDLFWTFGQFVDHDIGLTPVTQFADKKQPGFSKLSRSTADPFPIHVPRHDFFIKEKEMEFERTTLIRDRQIGIHENQHSSYADLGQVYGADFLRARALRSFSGGKLKVHGPNLPMFNKLKGFGALRAKIDNAPDADDKFFALGDVRGNEQTLLLALHIIWVREHNLVCDELSAKFPDWKDEDIYQTARAICIAEYQSILYDEWLPHVLGDNACPSTDYVYDASIDASISAIFSTVAFRFGHTIVGSHLLRLGPGRRSRANMELVPLRRVFFKPEIVVREGLDDYIRGAAWHRCKEFDVKIVDELRNFLFTEDESKGHMDLLSLNIQRGRDMGIPQFNRVRQLFGLNPYGSFEEFIEDEHLAAATESVYQYDTDNVDAFYGGIAEKSVAGALVGETFHTIIKSQFVKIRDGDRFFFTGLQWEIALLEAYPRLNDILARRVKLGDVILRNTGIDADEIGYRARETVFKL